ncbi:MAG: enoyl-CoA hydratase, partial [Actinobacteria bacterium]
MSLVRTEVDGGVGLLTLDDPGRRNALSLDMVGEIVSAMDDLEADGSIAAVVVTGAPPAFCAGADLSHLGQAGRGSEGGGLRSVYEGFLRVQRSPLATVAAVNGAAVGAGVNLALACDVRIVGRSARFDTRFLQLGLHPGGGHTWMMSRLLGPQAAAATVIFGDVLDGEAAERRGLAWRCVDDGKLVSEARAFAAKAASVPPTLARRVKQTLRQVATITSPDEAVSVELEAQLWSMQQPDFA